MTKEELQNKILDDMTIEYYSSNLCLMIDSHDIIETIGRGTIEESIYELLDDLSQCVIETMEEARVLREKQKIPLL